MAKVATRKPRLTREQQKAARSIELLDAAWTLFCEKGYESLTIDVVAEYAGYSRMPIYSLFGDKQNLFFELWKLKSADISHVLLRDCKAGDSLSDNLLTIAHNIVRSGQKSNSGTNYGEYLFFVVQTISLNRPDIREKLDALAHEHISGIAQVIEQSSLRKNQTLRASPQEIALQMIAYINGSSTVEFHTKRMFQTADSIHGLFLHMALR